MQIAEHLLFFGYVQVNNSCYALHVFFWRGLALSSLTSALPMLTKRQVVSCTSCLQLS